MTMPLVPKVEKASEISWRSVKPLMSVRLESSVEITSWPARMVGSWHSMS